jgi:repressor LexA
MTVGEKIREARLKKGYTQTELAELLGYKSRSSINKIEVEGRDIPRSSVIKFAKALDVTPAYLMGWEDEPKPEQSLYDRFDNLHPVKLKRFPLLGEIACGEPIYAEEDHESYVSADADIRADFCLKAKGDSMINADIHDGDVVFIRSQSMVENGEIAAVIIEDEATLKRVYYDRENNRLQLIAENPRYAPLVYTGEELNYIRILGKAVTLMREL